MGSSHGRAQALLLIQKLLDCRDNSSPFILVIDSIEQSAKPLLQECIKRAKAQKSKVVFVAFETLRPPLGVDEVVRAHEITPALLRQRVIDAAKGQTRLRIIIDSLHTLCSDTNLNLSQYLGSLISPNTTLLLVYHVDQPISRQSLLPYSPTPLTLLKFLATTILTLHSFHHVLVMKSAQERSLAPPIFGLAEGKEGIIQGLISSDARGLVIEMEHRRKSGRAISESYFLAATSDKSKSQLKLLVDHPLYGTFEPGESLNRDKSDLSEVTFSLGLTDKQRRDREEVILPYYDAQGGRGPGDGGRILYEIGVEDDFDEEEDEI